MNKQKGYTIVEVFFVVGLIAWLALFGTGLYVVGHFIAKFW